MDASLRNAVTLFNQQRFVEFQDALEAVAGATRAPSERQFYTILSTLAEALHQVSNHELQKAEETLGPALRRLDDFVPRFRSVNVEALREDCQRMLTEVREVRAGRKPELDPKHLPRLRILPA
jgi:predicted metal-dependent hydrolase